MFLYQELYLFSSRVKAIQVSHTRKHSTSNLDITSNLRYFIPPPPPKTITLNLQQVVPIALTKLDKNLIAASYLRLVRTREWIFVFAEVNLQAMHLHMLNILL